MNRMLRDLLEHQGWADAELWRAIAAHQPARDDRVILARLHHIHNVQRAFAWIVGDRTTPFEFTKPEDFESFDALRGFASGSNQAIRHLLDTMAEARLLDEISIPWAPMGAPQALTVTEALTQCAMHSHYHRGQNASRLRELGGEPPTTDLIAWYWKKRPPPLW